MMFTKASRSFTLISILCLLAMDAGAVSAMGQKIMISAQSEDAVKVGVRTFESGGNIVDAAVATALVMSVTNPYVAGLGGGGLALIKIKKEVRALDFRETAPRQLNENTFINEPAEKSVTGSLAVGVPGIPAGLFEMHSKYGRLPWKKLFDDAIAYAQGGFRVNGEWARVTKNESVRFDENARRTFLKRMRSVSGEKSSQSSRQTTEQVHNGPIVPVPYLPGDRVAQPQLVAALRLLQTQGVAGFYSGPVASDIVSSLKKLGGKLSLEDLKSYRARWLTPLQVNYAGHVVYLMPPPSSAGVVIASILKLADMVKLNEQQMLSTNELHLMSEVMKISFRSRSLLGDPAFVKESSWSHVLTDEYLKPLAAQIREDKTLKLEPLSDPEASKEPTETTHISLMDNDGNAIAMTLTMNGNYGSGVASEKYRIILNNEIDDFTTLSHRPNLFGLVQGRANHIAPGKRPLSSMAPTLVEKKGRTILALGGAGGPRIVSGVLQVLYRALNSTSLTLDQAVQAPRAHHQFQKDVLFLEPHRLSPDVATELKKRGHTLEFSTGGRVYAVRLTDDNLLEGAFDARGAGSAAGF